MFHERKLEYLGVTIRACGYQPQGVPSLKGTPPPRNKLVIPTLHNPTEGGKFYFHLAVSMANRSK